MTNNKILRHFVSELDQFLQTFDRTNPTLSASQKAEIEKYNRVYFLRDVSDRPETPKTLWEGF